MKTHQQHPDQVGSGKWTLCGNWTALDGLTDTAVQFWTTADRAQVTCKRCLRIAAVPKRRQP